MADWQFLTDFHFIRPLWLLGLLPAVLCFGLIKKINQQTGNWEKLYIPLFCPTLCKMDWIVIAMLNIFTDA